MTAEMRPGVSERPGQETFEFWWSGQLIGRLSFGGARDEMTARIELAEPDRRTREERVAMVEAVTRHAVRRSWTGLELDSHDVLIRHEARQRGFVGALRSPLHLQLPPRHTTSPGRDDHPAADRLAAAVHELVPGRPLVPRRPSTRWSRLYASTITGQAESLHFSVSAGNLGTFSLVLPDRVDLMPEPVAAVCDTAVAIYRAFPQEMRGLRAISFDRSEQGFSDQATRRLGGVARQGLGRISLNSAYVAADGIVELARHRADHPSPHPPLRSRAPATGVDFVVAHELGHIVDGFFRARRFRDTIEFRRALGHALGVATLEHAVRPRPEDGPAGQAAYAQLRDGVSAYATTNVDEAMAELFAAWWWHVEPDLPVLRAFDSMVHRFFVV